MQLLPQLLDTTQLPFPWEGTCSSPRTCIRVYVYVYVFREEERMVDRLKEGRGGEEKRGKEERGRLAIDSYFIIIINSTVISFVDELRSFLLHEFLYKFVSLTVACFVVVDLARMEKEEQRGGREERNRVF